MHSAKVVLHRELSLQSAHSTVASHRAQTLVETRCSTVAAMSAVDTSSYQAGSHRCCGRGTRTLDPYSRETAEVHARAPKRSCTQTRM